MLHWKADDLRTIPRRRFGQWWHGRKLCHVHKHVLWRFRGKALRLELAMVVGMPACTVATLRAAVVTPAVVLTGTISKFAVESHVFVWTCASYFVRRIWTDFFFQQKCQKFFRE